jgi:hypothetical protein
MSYSFDALYDYVVNGVGVTRWLCSFTTDNDELRNVEIEVFHDDQMTIKIVEEESDELTDDERGLFYYLLDRWAINNLI